jgi:hypothetical protein
VTMLRAPRVFLNGCLHIMGHTEKGYKILAMDMEGNT